MTDIIKQIDKFLLYGAVFNIFCIFSSVWVIYVSHKMYYFENWHLFLWLGTIIMSSFSLGVKFGDFGANRWKE